MLKRAHDPLNWPLTLLINQTLSTGIFPNALKISQIKPLFKQGKSFLFTNYRTISLLPSMSKIYECVVFEQLLKYMEDNRLFSKDQFGFRQGHSTELASLRLVDTLIQQMDNFYIPTSILIDLSKSIPFPLPNPPPLSTVNCKTKTFKNMCIYLHHICHIHVFLKLRLYCIVLYCIMRPYTDGPIGPLSHRHSSGVVRNPHSALTE